MTLVAAAFATAAVGTAVPANAATLGRITNFAPGYVFRSATPSRAEVESTVRPADQLRPGRPARQGHQHVGVPELALRTWDPEPPVSVRR